MRFFTLISICLLCLLSFSVSAQVSNSVSSSKRKAVFSKGGQQRLSVKDLLDSSDVYLETDRNKAFDYLEEAYLMSIQKRSTGEQYLVLQKLGDFYTHFEQHDLAALNYEKAMQAAPDQELQTKLLLRAGEQYVKAGLSRISLQLYERFGRSEEQSFKRDKYQSFAWTSQGSDSLRSVHVNDSLSIRLFMAFGDAYFALEINDSAFLYYTRADSLSLMEGLSKLNVEVKLRLAKVYSAQGNDQEIVVLNEAMQALDSISTDNSMLLIETETQNATYFYNNRYDDRELSSRSNILRTLDERKDELEAENIDVRKQRIQEQNNIARIHLRKQNYSDAIDILGDIPRSYSRDESKDILVLMKEAAQLRSDAYLKMGDEEKSLQSYEDYVKLLDKLYKRTELEYDNISSMSNQLRDHQWRIDFLEKDKAIYDAERELVEKERDIQRDRIRFQNWSIVFLVVLIAMLIITLVMILIRYRVQRKHNDYLALKSLRTRMNPHFIFNALNSINNFIVKNDELNANKYLGRFSKLMRSILNITEQDFIPLEKEVEILELYLQIEHIRFADTFNYRIELDDELDTMGFRIPPMLIQPYIENAIWHGLRYKEGGGGELLLQLALKDQLLYVRVEDNGIGRKRSMELKTPNQLSNEPMGIKTTQERLDILGRMYKKEIRYQISDVHESGEGTRVELWIPNLDE